MGCNETSCSGADVIGTVLCSGEDARYCAFASGAAGGCCGTAVETGS